MPRGKSKQPALSQAINFRLPPWLYEELRRRVFEREAGSLNREMIRLASVGYAFESAKGKRFDLVSCRQCESRYLVEIGKDTGLCQDCAKGGTA